MDRAPDQRTGDQEGDEEMPVGEIAHTDTALRAMRVPSWAFMYSRTFSAVTSVTVLPSSRRWTSSELPHDTLPK